MANQIEKNSFEFRAFLNENKIRIGVIALLLFVGCLGSPVACVSSGHRGVITTFGSVSDRILGEGIHIILPFTQRVHLIDTRVRKTEISSESPSRDLQEITTLIALNYHLLPMTVNKLYQEIGMDYEDTIITPAVLETMKFVLAQFTASELVTKRDEVSSKIQQALKEKLLKYYINVDEISIKNFQFSKTFAESIELKQKAEQDALRAKNELEKVKVEAEQQIAKARAEAESLRLRANQITPMMIQQTWIEKWDGKLPYFMTGSGGKDSFIFNLPK